MTSVPEPSRLHSLVRDMAQVQSTQMHDPTRPDGQRRKRGVVITVCTVVAFTLWLLLSFDDPGEIRLKLDTTIVNPPPDTAFAKLPVTSVMASVQGEVLTLFNLKMRPPVFLLDASRDVTVSQTAVSWPQGVTAQFDSPEIRLVREPRQERMVPVKARIAVEPVTGYSLFEAPMIRPESIAVGGAESIVRNLQAWTTTTVRQVEVKDSLTMELSLADSLPGLVSLSHDYVVLTAQAYRFTEGIRELTVIVTDVPNPENVVDLDPPQVSVVFHSPLHQFGAAHSTEDFYATVSYEAIREDTTGSVVPTIILPPDLLIRHMETKPRSLNYYVNTGLQ